MITGTKKSGSNAGVSCLITAIIAARALAAPIYVDGTATGGANDGTTWANAYLDFQDAITQAYSAPSTYPEIRVARGRYTPDVLNGSQSSRFRLINGVSIKGGYAGYGAPNPDDRNIPRYETILSGDLNGNDIPCDLETNKTDNCFTVVTGTEPDGFTLVDNTAVLDGFTVTGAYNGQGILLDTNGSVGASPTIQNCKISYNNGKDGLVGGIYCQTGSFVVVTNCRIEGNEAKSVGGIYVARTGTPVPKLLGCRFVRNKCLHFGGAVYLENRSAPEIKQCTFEANQAQGGGAISIAYSTADTRPTISDCKFINNEVLTNGGGGGGAITNSNVYPFTVVNCLFTGNKAQGGGGGGAVLNELGSTCSFVNCAFSRNTVAGFGGAIYNSSSGTANTLTLVNCSFSNNAATSLGGGVRGASQTTMVIRNSLFRGNTASDATTLAKQISTAGPTTTVSYSSIEGCSGCFGGNNNNGSDPLFVSAGADNLRLRSTSTVKDTGDNTGITGTDPDGNNRILNTTVDRGTYEFNSATDCNSNSISDNDDIASGTSYDCNHDGIPDECLAPCVKGDVNHDGVVDGHDIQAMVNRLLGASTCAFGDCESDVNADNAVNIGDIPCFANVLLGSTACAYTCSPLLENLGSVDCNGNEVNDANDIAEGTSQDCNANFIPDECDIDTNDPDGNELVSADVNSNSIPDECEPDCNHNSVPDAWDISQSTSLDVNANGIPDECEADCNDNNYPDDYDIAVQTSADCNLNGIPDECEQDCNENGVPDDCDIDPSDPDGNQQVSPDCNQNEYPDECDLTLPAPFGSFDCNENGVPDECDIADETSLDENQNGIPDECELGGSMGENSTMGGTGEGQEGEGQDLDAAWQAFYEWSFAQCWGPNCQATGAEQFQAYVDKLTELGLPIMGANPSP